MRKRIFVGAYRNAYGTMTSAHEKNVHVSDAEIADAARRAAGAQAGIHGLENNEALTYLPVPLSKDYKPALKSIEKSVAGRSPVETADTIFEKFGELRDDSEESSNVARGCGAAYAYALSEYEKLDREMVESTGRHLTSDTVAHKPYNKLFGVGREKLSPVQDAAFLQGIFYSGPEGPKIVSRLPKDRILNFVQRDPKMIQTVEDVSQKYWRESFGEMSGFKNVKSFDDLDEKQKEQILSFHQSVAVASIARNKLDNLNDAASGSVASRIGMAQFKRMKKKMVKLSSVSNGEERKRERASEMRDVYKSDMEEANDLQEKGLYTLTNLTRLSGYDAYFEGRKSEKKATRIYRKRRQKKNDLEEKALRMKSVPWWLRQRNQRLGITPQELL